MRYENKSRFHIKEEIMYMSNVALLNYCYYSIYIWGINSKKLKAGLCLLQDKFDLKKLCEVSKNQNLRKFEQ